MQRILASALMRLAVIAAALTLQQAAQAQTRELATKGELLDRVAAIVNDGVVLNSELDAQVEAVSGRLRQQKLELPPQNVLRQQVLERLVLQEIQMQRANRAGVKVSDETVNAALQDVAKRNGMTLSQLPDALAKQGEDYASYRDDLRKEITLSLLRQRDVLQHISVTPREIDQFLEKQAKTPSERNEYNVSHILIAVAQDASPAQLEQAAKRAADVYQRANGGGFLREEASPGRAEPPSGDRGPAAGGGDRGWAGPGPFAPEFEQAIAGLKDNEISEPFHTQFGWHIAQVLGHRRFDNTDELKRRQAMEAIRAGKADEETELWLRRMRDEAFVEFKS